MVKILPSMILQGALEEKLDKWNREDAARIKADASRRKKIADITEDNRKRHQDHLYWQKKENFKNQKKSAVNIIDPNFAFGAIDPDHWEDAKKLGFSVQYNNKDQAGRFGTRDTAFSNVTWLNQNARQLLDKPELLQQYPKLAEELLTKATQYIAQGRLVGRRVSGPDNTPLEGQYTADDFVNLHQLAELSMNHGFQHAGQAYFALFDSSTKSGENLSSPEANSIIQRAYGSSSPLSLNRETGRYIPKGIVSASVNGMKVHSNLNFLNKKIEQIGLQHKGSEGYRQARDELLNVMYNTDYISRDITSGKNEQGRFTSSSQLDFISAVVMGTSNYTFGVTKEGGLTYRHNPSQKHTDAASRVMDVLIDSRKLVDDSDRLIELNLGLQKVIGGSNLSGALNIKGVREVFKTVASAAKSLGLSDTVKNFVSEEGGFGDTVRNTFKVGIANDAQDKHGNNLKSVIDNSITESNKFIANLKENRGKNIKGYGQVTDELIQMEVEYQYLKIQNIFRIAKLIQGGTGGRGVSNMDFEAVARSLSQGSLATLKAEEIAFRAVREHAIDGYVDNMVHRFPDMQKPENKILGNAMREKIKDTYNRLQERRGRFQNEAEITKDGATTGGTQQTTRKKNISERDFEEHIDRLMTRLGGRIPREQIVQNELKNYNIIPEGGI